MTFVGIDLHKREFTVCYRRPREDLEFKVFSNTPAGRSEFLETVSCRDEAAVESVGFARHFSKLLAPRVKRLVHVHASSNYPVFKSIKKTDLNDAALLALGLEKNILPESRFRSEISHQLGCLLSTRETLIGMRISMTNYLYAIVAREGLNVPRSKMKYRIWRDRVPIENFEFGDYLSWLVFDAQIELIRENVLTLEKEIFKTAQSMKGYAVLHSIPYFGTITVATLLAYIDGIENFPSSKALCAYFGIVPRTRQSAGENIVPKKVSRYRAGAITRQGRKSARTAIVMSVNRVMGSNKSLQAFYERIKGRKGYRKARTAAARKLLTFVYFALKNGNPIQDFSAVDFSRPQIIPD